MYKVCNKDTNNVINVVSVFFVNFENISHTFPMFLLLNMNK